MLDWIDKELSHIRSQNPYKKPQKIQNYYKLDSNENIVLEERFIKAFAFKSIHDNDFREYPLEQFEALYKEISHYTNLSTKNIGLGNGSDQIMDLLLATIGKGKKVITINPTFSYFIDRCNLYKITTDLIDLNPADNSLDFGLFIKKAKDIEIVYIASPNNPTGNQFNTNEILKLIESLKDKLIIIDEAYIEFADYSLSELVTKYNNVIIMRTFSKAFGLAGARIGYLLSNEELIDTFNQYIQLPYPLSSFSMQLATEALRNVKLIKRSIDIIKQERLRIFKVLNELSQIKIYESHSNFFFFQTFNYFKNIQEQLTNEKILAKYFGDFSNYKGAMRITIGNEEMNNKIISVIEKTVK